MRPPPDPIAALIADEAPVPVGGERHHVLLRPAFHGDTLLTVELGTRPAVRLRCFPDRLDDPRAAPPYEARAVLEPTRVEHLRDELARALLGLAAPDDRRGCDGIGLTVVVLAGEAPPRRHAAWSPEAGQPRHVYFAVLHALARAELTSEPAQRRLDQVHGYLDLGLPARDRGGYPHNLQIFGRLASSDEPALTRFLAIPPQDAAVIVDMRNFEGMGSLLYPLFRRYARRPGALGWAVSPIARRQLREAGVPNDQVRDDLADAILRVTVRDAAR